MLSPEAAADLREIVDFIAEDNPAAARRFLGKLRAEMDRLVAAPGIGHRREDLTGWPVLFWPVGRYLVIYRDTGQAVEVVRRGLVPRRRAVPSPSPSRPRTVPSSVLPPG